MNKTQRNPRHSGTDRRTPSIGPASRSRPQRLTTSRGRQQLSLLDQAYPWRLDARTRSIGREGLAKARAALAAAPHHDWDAEDGACNSSHAA
jgi:hypothetical protein